MKKVLSVLLTLVLIITCLPFSVYATEKRYNSGDFTYTLSNGKATIKKYLGDAKELKIPSKLDNHPVVKIGVYAFDRCSSLQTIDIPNSILEIEESAFYECKSLVSVKLPNKLTTLSAFLFFGCNSLKEIQIPKNVTTIKRQVFANCPSLTDAKV